MMDAVPLKAVVNKVAILLAFLVQCGPSEETLAIVHRHYLFAFKGVQGGVIIDSRRSEKIREIIQMTYTHVSRSVKTGDNVRSEIVGVLSLSIHTFFSFSIFKDVIEYNIILSILIAKIRFLLEILTEADFSQINKGVFTVLQVLERNSESLKENPFDSSNLLGMTRALIDLFCSVFESFVKGNVTLQENAKELLELLQNIAICTDRLESYELLTNFHMKLLLHNALVISEFNVETDESLKLVEERLEQSIITSFLLAEFIQPLVSFQKYRSHRSHKVFAIVNKNIENNVMIHTLHKLRSNHHITDCPSTFQPIQLPNIKRSFKYGSTFQTIITSLTKGISSELLITIMGIVEKNTFLTIRFEEITEMGRDQLVIEKCIKRVEVMSAFNRVLCWILMIVHGFSKEDDLPLIALEFDSLLDSTEGISMSK
ncbi:hypothetical protein QTN25_008391 [Entamoeba marina]